MYIDDEQKHKQKEVKNHRILSMVLLIFIIFSVFAFIVLGLRSFNLIQFPVFIENLLYSKDEEEEKIYVDDQYIYNALKLYSNNTTTETEEIVSASFNSEQNIRSFLEEMAIADNLYIDSYSVHYDYISNVDADIERKTETRLFKKNDNIRYEIKSNGEEEIYIINKDKNFESYENLKTESYVSHGINENIDYIAVPNVFLIGKYLNILGENGVIEKFEIKRSEKQNIAEFIYYISSLNQREEYKVLLEAGVVLEIRMYRNDMLAYEYKVEDVKYQNNNVKTNEEDKFDIDENIFIK